jgi:multimeric flavodoxin WrbA
LSEHGNLKKGMKVIGVLGSPRKNGNTYFLLNKTLKVLSRELDTELIFLGDYNIEPCTSCLSCRETGECTIKDDMQEIIRKLFEADAIVLASPSYFGSVTAQMKTFMDRTWPLRDGRLKDKIGGSIVVGRRYAENTLVTLNTFLLRHGIIIGHLGVLGYAFEKGEITKDPESVKMAHELGERMLELIKNFNKGNGFKECEK